MVISILRCLVISKSIMKPDEMHYHNPLNKRFLNHILVVIIVGLAGGCVQCWGILIFTNKFYVLGFITLLVSVFGLYDYHRLAKTHKRGYCRKTDNSGANQMECKIPFATYCVTEGVFTYTSSILL